MVPTKRRSLFIGFSFLLLLGSMGTDDCEDSEGMAGKWFCEASCNLEGTEPYCSGRVTGGASGTSEEAACREAKRSATQKAPRGCYARHCQCRCAKA